MHTKWGAHSEQLFGGSEWNVELLSPWWECKWRKKVKVWKNNFAICLRAFDMRLTTIMLEVSNIRGRHYSWNVLEQDLAKSVDDSWLVLRLSILARHLWFFLSRSSQAHTGWSCKHFAKPKKVPSHLARRSRYITQLLLFLSYYWATAIIITAIIINDINYFLEYSIRIQIF